MATITWNPADGGSWTDTADWIGGIVPGVADTALITGGDVAIRAGTSVEVGGVIIQGARDTDLVVAGTLATGGGATLEGGFIDVPAGGLVSGRLDFQGGTLGTGSEGDVLAGTLNAVTLDGTPDIAGSFEVVGGLTVAAATADLTGGTFDIQGAQTLSGGVVKGLSVSIGGTLTIAAGLTADSAGGTLTFASDDHAAWLLINDGVLLATDLDVGTSLENNGQITLDGAGGESGIGGGLDNTGTIFISGGATGTIALNDNGGLIEVGAGGSFDAAESGPEIGTNTGTISLESGGVLEVNQTLSAGVIRSSGGTIEPVEGGLDAASILGAVTILGPLVGTGVTFAPAGGAAPDTITLAPQAGEGGALSDQGTLSLAAGTTLAFDTAVQSSFAVTGASIDLAGVVAALPTGTVNIEAASFGAFDQPTYGTLDNSGTIATASGETLIVAAAAITGAGKIALVAGATLELTPDASISELSAIDDEGGALEIGGTLDATGVTTTLTPGSLLSRATLLAGAVLQGGTFVAGGGTIPDGAILSATTWRGGLDLSGVAQTTLENGIDVRGSAGGPGLLSLAGANAQVSLLGDTTLDNLTVALGASVTNAPSTDISAINANFSTLTFGANATVTLGGNLPTTGIFDNETVVNLGTILATGTGSIADGTGSDTTSLEAAVFTNDGVIEVDPGNIAMDGSASGSGSKDPVDPFKEFFKNIAKQLADFQNWLSPPKTASGKSVARAGSVVIYPPTTAEIAAFQSSENTIDGGGTIVADAGSFVELDSRIAASQTLAFAGAGAVMVFADSGGEAAKITNFGSGDGVDFLLAGFIGGTPTVSGGDVVIPTASGDVRVAVSLAPGITASQLAVVEDQAGGTGLLVACFAEGTRIATPRGPVAVENLRPGDAVRTASGGVRPVVWTGHRSLAPRRHPRPHDVQPVRIRAGAVAPGMPARDVRLSPDHAVLLDGVLIPVRYLINGASVVQEDVARVSYWHVELARHDVVLAEGLPCESFLDTGNRGAFVEAGAAMPLHPDFARAVWARDACAPLTLSGPALTRARARLIDRLPALGHIVTADPGLRIIVDGAARAARRHGDWWRLLLPSAGRTLRLASRTGVPAQLDPASEDMRRLGVPLLALRLDGAPVALTDARLTEGWREPEPGLRWTDGDARIDLAGARLVEIAVARGLIRYHAAAHDVGASYSTRNTTNHG